MNLGNIRVRHRISLQTFLITTRYASTAVGNNRGWFGVWLSDIWLNDHTRRCVPYWLSPIGSRSLMIRMIYLAHNPPTIHSDGSRRLATKLPVSETNAYFYIIKRGWHIRYTSMHVDIKFVTVQAIQYNTIRIILICRIVTHHPKQPS